MINDLPFLTNSIKIERVEKLVSNLHDKTEFIFYIKSLKETLKKVHRMIKFNQNVWLKPYIIMNRYLRKIAKNELKKNVLKLMNNAEFGKVIENSIKHRDIKLAQQIEEQIILYLNQVIMLQSF